MYSEKGKNNRQTEKPDLSVALYKAAHFSFSVLLFSFCWLQYRYASFSEIVLSKNIRYDIYVVALFAVLLYLLLRTYNSYLLGYVRVRQLAGTQLISQFFSTAVIVVAVSVAWLRFKSPTVFVFMLAADAAFDCLWSISANSLFYKKHPKKRALLLYGDKTIKSSDLDIEGKPVERLISIEKEVFCCKENMEDILNVLEDYDVFFAVGISSECISILSLYCIEKEKDGYFVPNIGEIIFQDAYHIQSFHNPILAVKRKHNRLEYLLAKRLFDIVASLLGIIIFSPLMLIVAIVIKAYDGGPALYRQKRLTKDGREFNMYKFRSMIVNAEQNGEAVLSGGEQDSRITPVGKVIRAIRFDELPQLFNILRGDMTIVGPRPERPEIAEKYYRTLPEFSLRLQVKAGLTGYAQVYGKYNTSPEQKLKFDLMYINSMSMLTDIKLMFATLGVLFAKESTEGVKENAVLK